jgi:hypothetical protein
MDARLVVAAPGDPADARFLHVVQGSDLGAPLAPATLVTSTGGTAYPGVVVDRTAVMFPFAVKTAFGSLTYTVPATTATHLVTGLAANTAYGVTLRAAGDLVEVRIRTDGGGDRVITDDGGVLVVGSRATTGEWRVSAGDRPQPERPAIHPGPGQTTAIEDARAAARSG